jgi:membrane-associated PAP2 superfamily phosphatase
MLWLACSFFQFSLKKNNSIHFFNLPVTTLEKFTHALLAVGVIGIVIHLLAFAGAYTGYYFVRPLFQIEESKWIIDGSLWKELAWHKEAYWGYAAALAALLFGSIYFRTKALIKSIGTFLAFSFASSLYSFLLFYIAFGNIWNKKELLAEHSININIIDPLSWEEYYYVAPIAVIMFFLSLTYLRLRETEV